MTDTQKTVFFRRALSGRMDRRQVIENGLRLGIATPLLSALAGMPAVASASPATRPAAARTNGQATDSGTLTILFEDGTNDIDPHSTYTTLGSMICLNAYEMLIQYKGSSTFEYAPMLADSWDVSEDESSYTFHLSPNIKFHDDTICNAQAVKESFTRFVKLELGPYLVITRFVDDPDTQIVAVDDVTVRFDLGQPQPLFLAAMASSFGPYIVSPQAWKDNGTDEDPWAHEWLSFNAVGTGPYRLIENTLNEGVTMSKFDDYHRGWEGNHFTDVFIRNVPESATRRQLMEQGEGDVSTYNLLASDVAELQEDPSLQVLIYDSTRVNWAILNVPKLETVEARQGLCYAFPYQENIDSINKGLMKRSGPIPSTMRGYDPDAFQFPTDLDKAKELLAAGGWEEGSSFEYLVSSNYADDKTTAQLYQANLQSIGYDLNITEVDSATYDDMIYGDMGADERPDIMGGWAWWPDYNDPWNQLAPNFLKSAQNGGGSNGGGYENATVEDLMSQAEHFTDEDQLDELMKQIQQILIKDDPAAIFYGETKYYTILKAGVGGFVPNPLYLGTCLFYDMYREEGA
ncbi:MAG TPA: ABC transporter substrate-binding protein [Thermomicrobiales bacterium]|nr:ABC transporter substrate-binding protein [Thermomicrobiales bacterium]